MERPSGITAISIYYFLLGAYACIFAALKLITSGSFTLMIGAPLRNELEFYREYYALVAGIAWILVGWGLLRLRRWARWMAMAGMVLAVASLVGPISIVRIGGRFFWYGFLLALHAGAGFYLAQAPTVAEAFEEK